ncbi:helix-turn-helix domain-containing protein [Geothermobacter hydrogeniphilus]|uniref:Transcriptional regulator n=1 Tax=Geothermobacter hydrogeniphilus TaxID=1969733 RepID=A0A1X0Y5A5_9BACT|nr:helix-turn-helix transcriptional regulator [Geothermobacter hydrogeniphilus]ORJ60288.1 transcriptional regulator [Geothermobacter hydrogeniphilus]
MLKIHLKRLIADKETAEGRRISLSEISAITGIHISTLSRLANHRSTDTTTANLEKLCRYFKCSVADLIEYVED